MSSRVALGFGLALAVVLAFGGCAGPYGERRDEPVVRRFGERLVEGAYVSPAAYEHYILAMLRESAGRPEEAVDELRRALGSDGTSAYLRVRLADALLSTGRLDEARDELEAALRLEPDSAEAYVVKARLHARLGERGHVEAALDRAIVLDPTLEEAYLTLAASQRDAGHEDRALATLRRLVTAIPSAAGEELLGRAAIKARDRRAAREHLRRAVELDPSRNEARLELARLCFGDGDLDLALQLYSDAAERTREPGLALELVRACERAGRHAEALALLDRLDEDARTPLVRLEVASAFAAVGTPKRARTVAEAVLAEERRAETRAAARATAAAALEQEGSAQEALAAWAAIGPGDGEYTRAIQARARLLRQRGRDREAVSLLETAIADRALRAKLDERDQLAVTLGTLRAELGDRDSAVNRLEELISARPQELPLRLGLARIEAAAGRWARAVALLEVAARGGQLRALHQLGDTLVAAGRRIDDAIRMLEKAESMAPHEADVADSLGAAYLAAGRLDDAERLLLRADRQAAPDVDVLLHLAQLWQKRDKHDLAIAALQRALKARPGERVRQEIEAKLLMLERGRVGTR
jgi:tetratricopeptide (TPR) repeat protein